MSGADMHERGIMAAFRGWVAMIAQPQLWLVGLLLALFGGFFAYLSGTYRPASGDGNPLLFALGTIGSSFGMILLTTCCHFYLARKLGGDGVQRSAPVIWKWLVIELVIWLTYSLPTILLVLTRSDYPTLFGQFAIQLAMLLFLVMLLPLTLRMVAAIHSGNRHQTRAITRFVGGDSLAWFGGYLIISIAMAALGMGITAAILQLDTALPFVIPRLTGGFTGMFTFAFVIAAYRAMDQGGEDEAGVFV